jgi:hypothetical protein
VVNHSFYLVVLQITSYDIDGNTMIATLRHYPTVLLFVALFALTGDKCFCNGHPGNSKTDSCVNPDSAPSGQSCCKGKNSQPSEKVPASCNAADNCCSGLWSVTEQSNEGFSTQRVSFHSIDELIFSSQILDIHSFVAETVFSVPPRSRSPIVNSPGILNHPLRT